MTPDQAQEWENMKSRIVAMEAANAAMMVTNSELQNKVNSFAANPPGLDATKQTQRVVLDEKYFRRIDKFDGDVAKYRGWIFELEVILGQVDDKLGMFVRKLLSKKDLPDIKEMNLKMEVESMDGELDGISEKYSAEMYGVLVSLTNGDAKTLVKSA